jgi:hypothetical protein
MIFVVTDTVPSMHAGSTNVTCSHMLMLLALELTSLGM